MRLCFGTFATVLNLCRQNITQADFVARIASVIDEKSSYIISNNGKHIEGDRPSTTKLLKCRINYALLDRKVIHRSSKDALINKFESVVTPFIDEDKKAKVILALYDIHVSLPDNIINEFDKVVAPFIDEDKKAKVILALFDVHVSSQDTIIRKFESVVAPFIDEDKKAKVILALFDIIQKDTYLDSDKKENFKKYIGVEKQDFLKRGKYHFSSFLGSVLLYTVYGNVDNTVGKEYVESITSDYIDNVAESYLHKYQWNSDMNILTLFLAAMYNGLQHAIEEYKINILVENIDPTFGMEVEWPEKMDDFVKYIKCKVINFPNSNLTGMSRSMFEKIQEFTEILDKYNVYLGRHMYLTGDSNNVFFVPMHRDENVKWALEFDKGTKAYRKALISIYTDIHMIFVSEYRITQESYMNVSE